MSLQVIDRFLLHCVSMERLVVVVKTLEIGISGFIAQRLVPIFTSLLESH